jgi:hypothetical protein
MAKSAVDLKNEGNKAFSSGDYPHAVELYSKAIALNDKEPLFLTNRAQVRDPADRQCGLGLSLHTSSFQGCDARVTMPSC